MDCDNMARRQHGDDYRTPNHPCQFSWFLASVSRFLTVSTPSCLFLIWALLLADTCCSGEFLHPDEATSTERIPPEAHVALSMTLLEIRNPNHELRIGRNAMTVVVSKSDYRTAATITPQVIRPGRSSLRTTFQLAADVPIAQGMTVDDVFVGTAQVVMDWLDAKFPQTLPRQARNMESFDLDHHGQQQLSGISLPDNGLWSVRLVQPDAPYKDRPAVAGRTWTTELALHRTHANIRIGVRVLCASAPYAVEPITLTRPRVVIDISQKFGLSEIRPLDGQPWILECENDLCKLYDLLVRKERTLPVILLTQPDDYQWQVKVSDYLLDETLLARRTQGTAHVVCMPMILGFAWTKMATKIWSAFHGAIRTYYPRLNLDEDSPFAHPRVLADRVLFYRYNNQEGESAFASFLIDKMAEHAAGKSMDWGPCLFFADARTRRAEVSHERIKKEIQQQSHAGVATLRAQISVLQKAHDEAVEALKAKIADAQKDVEEFDDLAAQYKQEAERHARENRSLQSQNDALRLAVEAKTGKSTDTDIRIPDNYDDMAEWVEDHFAGRLVLHPRAVQGIKKAKYDDITLVYQCLILLAGEYRNMRLGYDEAKKAWEEGLARLKLRCDPSITKSGAGEQGETYYVRYPIGSDRRQLFERHLCKGSTKDDHYCLRIYFFWDDDSSQVVVGWLPSHLDTRAT